MATVNRKVRNRQSPGGVITCDVCGDIVSRRRYNNALRFGLKPNCKTCKSTSVTISGQHEVRGRRLVFTPRRVMKSKTVQGSNRAVRR